MRESEITLDEGDDAIRLWCRRLAATDDTGDERPDLIQLEDLNEPQDGYAITVGEDMTIQPGPEGDELRIDLHTGSELSSSHDALWFVDGVDFAEETEEPESASYFFSRAAGSTETGAPITPVTATSHSTTDSPPTFLASDTTSRLWPSWFSGHLDAFEELDAESYLLNECGGLHLYSAGIPFAKLTGGVPKTGLDSEIPPYLRIGHPAVSPQWNPRYSFGVLSEELPGSGNLEYGGDDGTIETQRIPTMADANIRLYNKGQQASHVTTLADADESDVPEGVLRANLRAGSVDGQAAGIVVHDTDGDKAVEASVPATGESGQIEVGDRVEATTSTASGVSVKRNSRIEAAYEIDSGQGTLTYDAGTLTLAAGTDAEVTETVQLKDGFSGTIDEQNGGELMCADADGVPTIEFTTGGDAPTGLSIRDPDGNAAVQASGSDITIGADGAGGDWTVTGTGGETVFSINDQGDVYMGGDFVYADDSK